MSTKETTMSEAPAGRVNYMLAMVGVLTLVFAPTVLMFVLNLVQKK